MPSMKKFPEFELSQTLITAFSEAIGPTRMNKTTPTTRGQLMALATKTAVLVGMIMEGKEPVLLSYTASPPSYSESGSLDPDD